MVAEYPLLHSPLLQGGVGQSLGPKSILLILILGAKGAKENF